jgi:NAD(P)H-nitrite reductase large subunit
MTPAGTIPDPVVCYCLRVSESQVVDCIAVTGCETVRDVMQQIGAGGGCTACHCRIRDLLAARTIAPRSAPPRERVG